MVPAAIGGLRVSSERATTTSCKWGELAHLHEDESEKKWEKHKLLARIDKLFPIKLNDVEEVVP